MPIDYTHRFSFFGRTVTVTCDDGAVADGLAHIYDMQRANGDGITDGPVDGHLQVRVESNGPLGPTVRVAGRTVRCPSNDQLLHHAHLVLVNAAAAQAHDVQVWHAGAVQRRDRAIVLVGPSGCGKTTITLALLRRGWQLLSDDFAPVAADGLVHPFPRRLNVTNSTLALLDLSPPSEAVRISTHAGHDKWMVDPHAFVPNCIGSGAALHAVFVVEPRPCCESANAAMPYGRGMRLGATEAKSPQARPAYPHWRLQVDHLPEGIAEQLSGVPGIRCVVSHVTADRNVLDLTIDMGARVVRAVDDRLASFDVSVLAAMRPGAAAADSGHRPRAEALTTAAATRMILPHDLGLSGQRFLYGSSQTDLRAAVQTLTQTLAGVDGKLFRLLTGDPDQTVDLIETCAERDGSAP